MNGMCAAPLYLNATVNAGAIRTQKLNHAYYTTAQQRNLPEISRFIFPRFRPAPG